MEQSLVRIMGKVNRFVLMHLHAVLLSASKYCRSRHFHFIFSHRHSVARTKSINIEQWFFRIWRLIPQMLSKVFKHTFVNHLRLHPYSGNPGIVVQWHSPSSLAELEMFCKAEWATIPKSKCAKIVASYPKKMLGCKCCSLRIEWDDWCFEESLFLC